MEKNDKFEGIDIDTKYLIVLYNNNNRNNSKYTSLVITNDLRIIQYKKETYQSLSIHYNPNGKFLKFDELYQGLTVDNQPIFYIWQQSINSKLYTVQITRNNYCHLGFIYDDYDNCYKNNMNEINNNNKIKQKIK